MTAIGYTPLSEENGARQLVAQAVWAEELVDEEDIAESIVCRLDP